MFETPPCQNPQEVIQESPLKTFKIEDFTFYLPEDQESNLSLLGIIKPKPKNKLPYEKLPCSEDDKCAITSIISWMAEHGKLWLLAHKSEMNRLGDSIRHVHPLKFLETIFTDSYLKDCMAEILEDYFKRKGLLDGLEPNLDAKMVTGDLERHIPGFCQAIGVSEEALKPFFNHHAWEDMVRYLINT